LVSSSGLDFTRLPYQDSQREAGPVFMAASQLQGSG
jgi:hypothetical protein